MTTESKKVTAINQLKELIQMVACEHDDTLIQAIDEITILGDYDSAIITLENGINDMIGRE